MLYLSHYSVTAAAKVWMCVWMKVLCRLLNLILQNRKRFSCGKMKLNIKTSIDFTTFLNICAASGLIHSGFSSGWSVALVTPRCASGTLRQVSVYTSSWATWRRFAASSTTGGGWSAVPTTSWSKCGTPRRRPASTRCRATPTECTHYRWAASDSFKITCTCTCTICIQENSRTGLHQLISLLLCLYLYE